MELPSYVILPVYPASYLATTPEQAAVRLLLVCKSTLEEMEPR